MNRSCLLPSEGCATVRERWKKCAKHSSRPSLKSSCVTSEKQAIIKTKLRDLSAWNHSSSYDVLWKMNNSRHRCVFISRPEKHPFITELALAQARLVLFSWQTLCSFITVNFCTNRMPDSMISNHKSEGKKKVLINFMTWILFVLRNSTAILMVPVNKMGHTNGRYVLLRERDQLYLVIDHTPMPSLLD